MMHYYEDTLSAGADELAFYTDQMEHLTGVLDHYYSIMVMINGEYNYDSLGALLEGKAENLKNELDVVSANYNLLMKERAEVEAAYNNAIDDAAKELLGKELKAIIQQVNEAHDVMLNKTKEWAEAQKAVMENVMKKAAREMVLDLMR